MRLSHDPFFEFQAITRRRICAPPEWLARFSRIPPGFISRRAGVIARDFQVRQMCSTRVQGVEGTQHNEDQLPRDRQTA